MSPQSLPDWARELRNRYLSGESSQFLLHGNVRDLQPWTDSNGQVRYLDLRAFLESFLGRTRDIVLYYNVSQGICFPDKTHERRFQRAIDAGRMLEGEEKLTFLPRSAASAVPLIEELIVNPNQASGVILDFFEMVAPRGDVTFMTAEDKASLVSLTRWSTDPAFLSTDNLVILIAEHLSDVSRRVISSPQLVTISLPFPDESERARFVEHCDLSEITLTIAKDQLAKSTGGLSLIQIRSLFRAAIQSREEVTFRTVSRRKKQIIEQSCAGLVEFVDPDHNFSHVGGLERIKKDLLRVADAVKAGQRNRVPMGMIFVGPMGTGKTFVAEAFAAECGLTCLKFKNFREKWVGSTEGNLERVLELVEALGYVLLIIDEADRSLSAGGDNDGGTSSRVIARLKEFMSDTSHRGRVVVLMMTNRPDKLDTDLKRPGRFDFKIPFFFPEEDIERKLIMEALVRKNHLVMEEEISYAHSVQETEGFSGAELEAVLLNAANLAAEEDSEVITQGHLDRAAEDTVPSRDTRMLAFMEMLAVFEASAKRMLPQRYQEIPTDDVLQQLDQLRMQLGRRAL